MANHASAAKATRQSERRKQRNRSVRSAVKTQLRGADEALASGEGDGVDNTVKMTIRALDRAAKKGVLHPNNVARRKSRLMKKLNAAAT